MDAKNDKLLCNVVPRVLDDSIFKVEKTWG